MIRILLLAAASLASIPALVTGANAAATVKEPTANSMFTKIDEQVKAQELKSGTTLENLLEAFNGESNASAKYKLYAKKADEEGFGEIASLFRAASAAEAIHAANHAEVIKALGGTPKAEIKEVKPASTRENLIDAYTGETYERLKMYPVFYEQARQDGNARALRTINYAQTAEEGHAKLYKDALTRFDSLKGSANVDFLVCPTCGWTVSTVDFKKCPVCFTEGDTFRKVK